MRINSPILSPSLYPRAEGKVSFSQAQLYSDKLWETFSHEATNPVALASMTLGSLAYRLVRMGILQASAPIVGSGLLRLVSQAAAPLLGLSAEVTVFEGSQRFFSSLSQEFPRNESFAESWKRAWINFSMIKSVGHLLKTENIFLRHLSQDGAMVTGHYATGFLGWTPLPDESLCQQLLQAEAINLSLQTGGVIVQGAFGGRLSILERALGHPLGIAAPFSWQRSLTRMALEPIKQRPVEALLENLRRSQGENLVEAFRELSRRLVEQDLDADASVKIFEALETASQSNSAMRLTRLAILSGVLETADFRKVGPQAIFKKIEQWSPEEKMVALERGWGSDLLRNPHLGETNRLLLADWVDEIWRADSSKQWPVDLMEAQSRALALSREALALEHVEGVVLARIVGNVLRFAEEESYWFVRLEDYDSFVSELLKSDRVREDEQQRLVDIYVKIMTRADLNLLAGERVFMLQALEEITGDMEVPDLLRGYARLRLNENAPAVLSLAVEEFSTVGVVSNDELACETLLRPDLPSGARQSLLMAVYYALVEVPPQSTWAHGYSRAVEFARQHYSHPLFEKDNRFILMLILLKADIDLASFDNFVASLDNPLTEEPLQALRTPVKEALRGVSNQEKTDFAIAVIFLGKILKPLEAPAVSLDQYLRQLIFYIRDPSALRESLPPQSRRGMEEDVRERVRLVRQILDAG